MLAIARMGHIYYMYVANVSDSPVVSHLKSLGPSAIDTALRLLAENDGGSDEVMTYFLEMVQNTLLYFN